MTRSDLLPDLLTKDLISKKQRLKFLASSHIIYLLHGRPELRLNAVWAVFF